MIIKIHSIDQTESTHGRTTPGVDGQRFKKHIKIPSLKKLADREILDNLKRIHPAFFIRSTAKGTNK